MNIINIKKNSFLFFLTMLFLVILIFTFYLVKEHYLNNKIAYYNQVFEKANRLMENQDFLKALSYFEGLYFSGFKTISVIKNCIYLYQMTNQTDKLYRFIRISFIDKGFYPEYKKYLCSILSEDYKWIIKANLIDYINIYIIIFFELISLLIFFISLLSIKKDKKLKNIFFIILILNLIVLCLFFLKTGYYLHRNEAISIEHCDVFNFPLKDATPIFTIQEHVKLKVIGNFESFTLIKLQNDKSGWIKTKSILKVFNE